MRRMWNNATTGYADWQYHRQVGTNPWECWYVGNAGHEAAMSSVLFGPNFLCGVGFVAPRGGTLDRIGIYVTSASAQRNARLGIYNSTTNGTNLYPGSLLLDAGTVSLAAGLRSIVINQALTAGTLYWLAMVDDDTDFANQIRHLSVGVTNNYNIPLLGLSATAVQQDWFLVAQAYGALPANFPAGATLPGGAGNDIPGIGVRYSA